MIGRGARSFASSLPSRSCPHPRARARGRARRAHGDTGPGGGLTGQRADERARRNAGRQACSSRRFPRRFALGLRRRARIKWGPSTRSAAGWLTSGPRISPIGPHSRVSCRDGEGAARRSAGSPRRAFATEDAVPFRPAGRAAPSARCWSSLVRAPGPIVRRLEVGAFGMSRAAAADVLELIVVIVERDRVAAGARTSFSKANGDPVAGCRRDRDLRRGTPNPRLRYRGGCRTLTAHVVIPADGGRRRLERTSGSGCDRARQPAAPARLALLEERADAFLCVGRDRVRGHDASSSGRRPDVVQLDLGVEASLPIPTVSGLERRSPRRAGDRGVQLVRGTTG